MYFNSEAYQHLAKLNFIFLAHYKNTSIWKSVLYCFLCVFCFCCFVGFVFVVIFLVGRREKGERTDSCKELQHILILYFV